MELSSQDQAGDIPIPLNTSTAYGHHVHLHHGSQNPNIIQSNSQLQPQNQIPPPSNGGRAIPIPISSSTQTLEEDHHQDHDGEVPYNRNSSNKKSNMVVVRYKECLKNHAAAMGGNATDGCGEFMPSGEEGTIEALTCSACNCHRNFHRKEIQGSENHPHHPFGKISGSARNQVNLLGHHQYYPKNVLAPTPESLGYPTPTGTLIASRALPHHHHMIMSYHNMGSDHDQSDEDHGHHHYHTGHHDLHQVAKKRFRTKFTQEQKEKMLSFAEKVGWKIQKQEDSVVQQFCQEIGVKRRVLKVWMHNNKHNLAKKNNNLPPPTTTTAATT